MWRYNYLAILMLLIKSMIYSQGLDIKFENQILTGWKSLNIDRWHIDTVSPISDRGSLHHNYNNDASGIDYIFYPHDILCFDSLDTEWSFKLLYGSNPSISNNWSVHLTDYSLDPSNQRTQGYIIGVNYTGSDDLLKIWKRSEKGTEEIVVTEFDWDSEIEKDDVVSVNIQRSCLGEWKIAIDTSQTNNWMCLGQGFDSQYSNSCGIGVYYKYTSSNDRILWIDDIKVNGYFSKDIFPPRVDTFFLENSKMIQIIFNEAVDTGQVFFSRLNRQDNLKRFKWIGLRNLALEFYTDFQVNNLLELYSIIDYKGNLSQIIPIGFEYYFPQKHDIIVTEILADPLPTVGLPNAEFIELHNRSNYNISLKGWILKTDNDEVVFEDHFISQGSYLIITDPENVELFDRDLEVLGVKDLPSLSNMGSSILLLSNQGKLIHGVQYDRDNYQSQAKKKGGWSLELVDSSNPCVLELNWVESKSPFGGTPGKANSVSGRIMDTLKPWIEHLAVIDRNEVLLIYSEPMDSISIQRNENYFVDKLGHPQSLEIIDYLNLGCKMKFDQDLAMSKVYELELGDRVTDCSGNSVMEGKYCFGMPQNPDSADIIFNEILFEGTDKIPEFIELFNRSDKVIDLRNYRLVFFNGLSDFQVEDIFISNDYLQLLPGEYISVTESKRLLINHYKLSGNKKVTEISNWKKLSNSEQKIGLVSIDESIIDIIVYNSSMHSSLISNTSGISLERINANHPGDNAFNWHSASSLFGYGTPCEHNSQRSNFEAGRSYFTFSGKSISPDNNGSQDYLEIAYHFPQPGYFITVFLFNKAGELIRSLAQNELAGTTGKLIWDGTSNNGKCVPMGYYIILMKAFNDEGHRIQEKEAVLVLR